MINTLKRLLKKFCSRANRRANNSDEIDFGGFKLGGEVLISQLRKDLKDDWFKDPLMYEDLLDKQKIKKNISENIQENNGHYRPSKVWICDIPKKKFTLRYAIEKNFTDRVFYHGLTIYLIKHFDKLFSPRSYSHRYQPDKKKNKHFIFKNGVEQWIEFTGVVRSKIEPGMYLLETDLNTYFELIEIHKIKERLLKILPNTTGEKKENIEKAIFILFKCLPFWTFNQNRGLPQNRDASSFLANVMMDEIDHKMVAENFEYYRYMDDIKIICKNEHHARKALLVLTRLLRKQGLGVNSEKTKIMDCATAIEHLKKDVRLELISELFRGKKKYQLLRGIHELMKYTLELIESGQTQERAFRFCIGKLSKLQNCEDFSFDKSYLIPVTDQIIIQLDKAPVSTDKYIEYLQHAELNNKHINDITNLLLDQERAIYTWQNYQLWNLLIYKKILDPRLKNYAQKIIQLEDSDPAERAGAALYLGANYGHDERLTVAKNFKLCKEYIAQRGAIIAIHELHYDDIKDYVPNYVLPELKGVFGKLRKGKFKGKYFTEQAPYKLTNIFETGAMDAES